LQPSIITPNLSDFKYYGTQCLLPYLFLSASLYSRNRPGRQADRQAHRQTGRQADRQTGRQADRLAVSQSVCQAGRQAGMLASR
jgi:hypothetical protein